MTTSAFLSHAHAYAELARRIARDLAAAGIEVMLDPWQGGGGLPLVQSVPRGIGRAAFVLPLLTPSEATRSWIGAEWKASIFDEAVRRGVAVLPIRGEVCEDVPDFLLDRSFADLRHRGYELELARLIATIRVRSGDRTIELPRAALADASASSPAAPALVVEFGESLAHVREGDGGLRDLAERITSMIRDGLFGQLGVPFPEIEVRESRAVPPWSARFRIHGFDEAQVDVPPGCVLVREPAETLQSWGFAASHAPHPSNGAPCCWIAAEARQDPRIRQLSAWDGCEVVFLASASILGARAYQFIDVAAVREMLGKLAFAFPHLVSDTVPGTVSDFIVSDVLRRLVSERVSIRNLPRILMSLADWGRVERDPVYLTEHVRVDLQRQISHGASRGSRSIAVFLIDPEIEWAVASAIRNTPTGSYLDLEPERVRAIVTAIQRAPRGPEPREPGPVLLAGAEVRASIRRLIAPVLPDLEVVSFAELRPDFPIRPAGCIRLDRFEPSQPHEGALFVW